MKKKHNLRNYFISIVTRIIFILALLALIWYLIVPNSSLYYMNKTYHPFFNRLNKRDIIMIPGETFKLRLQRVNTRVKFSSLDIKVAPVTPLGTVIALRPGKTFVSAKYQGKVIRCRVRVIKLNKRQIDLKIGEDFDLDIKGPIIFKKTKWASSDSKIAKVNRFGKVKGVSRGRATITGKIGDKKLQAEVVVK